MRRGDRVARGEKSDANREDDAQSRRHHSSVVLQKQVLGTPEARRLTEVARALGLGDSPDEAIRLNQELLSLFEESDETPFVADVLRWQATVLRDRGKTSDAEPLYRRSLDLATRLGYEPGRAHALNYLGSLALRRGDVLGAMNLMSDALEIAEQCRENRLVGMLQQNLGVIADVRGNPAAALAHYRVSLRMFEQTNDLQSLCCVLNNLGYLQLKEGDFDDAETTLERAIAIARERGDLMSEGVLRENLAELWLRRGDLERADSAIDRCQEIAQTRADNLRLAAALKLQGAAQRMRGLPAEAADTLRHAMSLSAVAEDALLGAEILYQFGMCLQVLGDRLGSKESLTSALEAFERIGARQWVSRARERLTGGDFGRYL